MNSVLALTFDGSRLEGVVLKRQNSTLQQLQKISAPLTLDPLTAAPELVGQEIRNHLDAAGVREKNCIIGLPLRWLLTAQTELPAGLEDADAASLVQLEAEKNFHTDISNLHIADSRCALADGKQLVLLAAMPHAHLGALQGVLAAAKLKPASFALGINALSTKIRSGGALTLVIGENSVGLQINAGGAVIALRALEGAAESAAGRAVVHSHIVAREVRVTLGQLPAELRAAVKTLRIFGPRELAQPLADELELKLEAIDLAIEIVAAYPPDEFGATLPLDVSLSSAFSLAANALVERKPALEFLPPKISSLDQLVAKYTSGKLGKVGALAACMVVLLVGLFLFQQIQLWSLRAQWKRMAPKVTELQSIQEQIRFYRPWYDDSFRSLAVLRQVTLAFPEDGSVTAKTIDIRDGSTVSCSGNARDNSALIAVLARLRAAGEVSALKLDQIRGKSPMQFTFNFKYGKAGAP